MINNSAMIKCVDGSTVDVSNSMISQVKSLSLLISILSLFTQVEHLKACYF